MTQLLKNAFTDYPDGTVRAVQLLSYDNNKYARVRFEDGREEDIKAGYIKADAQMSRPVAEVHWHVLGGGSRRSFKQRSRKTTYQLYQLDPHDHEGLPFDGLTYETRAGAVFMALRFAAEYQTGVSVFTSTVTKRSSSFNHEEIVCEPNGQAYVRPTRKGQAPKFLRGYGKYRSAWR